MRVNELKTGDQVREKCGGTGGQFLGRFGYVVDPLEEGMYSIVWTHDTLGHALIFPSASRIHLFDLWATGKIYSEKLVAGTLPGSSGDGCRRMGGTGIKKQIDPGCE